MRKSASAKRRLRLLLRHDAGFLNRGFQSLAGVDEVGRGPLAGPVVASAVIVRDASFSCAIDDSKRLTPETREVAYREILQKARVAVSVKEHTTVDELNIFWASMAAMQDAVRRLPECPDYVLVDGNHAPEFEPEGCRKAAVVKGDSKSLAIACASIVAKVTRDRIMEEYDKVYPQYGFARHKGYCTRSHIEALKKHGPTPIHRRSFEPIKSMVSGQSVNLDAFVKVDDVVKPVDL